jgi:hypothetical protein
MAWAIPSSIFIPIRIAFAKTQAHQLILKWVPDDNFSAFRDNTACHRFCGPGGATGGMLGYPKAPIQWLMSEKEAGWHSQSPRCSRTTLPWHRGDAIIAKQLEPQKDDIADWLILAPPFLHS